MRRLVIAFALLGVGSAVGIAACSLGLDPSLIGKEGGVDGASDASADGGPDAPPNPVGCTSDPDCKSANACLQGHCDTVRKNCVYDLCPLPQACQVAKCDKSCAPPSSYGFHAGSFKITTGNIGCGGGGGGARRCIAAVFPFVFVGTTNGVVAYMVADPTRSDPPPMPVGGLPFFPTWVVASGSRVYFVSSVLGTGPNYKMQIAWVDPPTDPTVTSVYAATVFDTVSPPSVSFVFPDSAGGLYFVNGDGTKSYPAARIAAPLKDLDTIPFFASAGAPDPSTSVAGSGKRIIFFRNPSFGQYAMSFETNAATSSAQNDGDQDVTAATGPMSGPSQFAMGDDGAVLWHANALDQPDAGSGAHATKLSWIVQDANDTKIAGTINVDTEAYSPSPGAGSDLPGPIAWLDSKRALVASASKSNTNQTAIQVATRDPSPQMVPNRRFVLPFKPSEIGMAATHVGSVAFGYVLAQETDGPIVHVFGGNCDN